MSEASGVGRKTWEYEHGVTCVVCPECAFTFDAVHTNERGGYSCPNCGYSVMEWAGKVSTERNAPNVSSVVTRVRATICELERLGDNPREDVALLRDVLATLAAQERAVGVLRALLRRWLVMSDRIEIDWNVHWADHDLAKDTRAALQDTPEREESDA